MNGRVCRTGGKDIEILGRSQMRAALIGLVIAVAVSLVSTTAVVRFCLSM